MGAGFGLYNSIDRIDTRLHSIECVIDSDKTLSGEFRNGLQVKHYKEIDINEIDCIINTTSDGYGRIKATISEEWDEFPLEMFFGDINVFLAYEYINMVRKDIKMNPLYHILQKRKFNLDTDKQLQYLDVYHRYMNKFREEESVICEIGVFHGDSLKIWKEYFGSKCKIIGIDIAGDCLRFKEENVEIEIGSQSSPYFWNYIKEKYPKIDVLIDDGGHTMNQQILTWLEMFPHLSDGGIYICEDICTSYMYGYQDDCCREKNFVEFAQEIVNAKEAAYWKPVATYNERVARDVEAVHFYHGMVVFEKRKQGYPILFNSKVMN